MKTHVNHQTLYFILKICLFNSSPVFAEWQAQSFKNGVVETISSISSEDEKEIKRLGHIEDQIDKFHENSKTFFEDINENKQEILENIIEFTIEIEDKFDFDTHSDYEVLEESDNAPNLNREENINSIVSDLELLIQTVQSSNPINDLNEVELISYANTLTSRINNTSQIPIVLDSKESSYLKLSVKKLDYGALQTDKTKDLAFTVKNTSSQTITNNVFVKPPYRIIPNKPFVLTPGKKATLTLRFSPKSSGTYLANATISSNIGTKSIILVGTQQ